MNDEVKTEEVAGPSERAQGANLGFGINMIRVEKTEKEKTATAARIRAITGESSRSSI